MSLVSNNVMHQRLQYRYTVPVYRYYRSYQYKYLYRGTYRYKNPHPNFRNKLPQETPRLMGLTLDVNRTGIPVLLPLKYRY